MSSVLNPLTFLMRSNQPNDVGHQNMPPQDEVLAASAIAQFYTFAGRCMDWAKTTRSLQERALYVCQAAGAAAPIWPIVR